MFFSLYCLLAGQCHKQVLVMFIQVSANTYATARWCRQNTTISAPSRRARVTARSSSSSLADRAPRWRSTPPPTPRSAQWQIYRRWQPANSLRSCSTVTDLSAMTASELTQKLFDRMRAVHPIHIMAKLPLLDDVRAVINVDFADADDLWKHTAPKRSHQGRIVNMIL